MTDAGVGEGRVATSAGGDASDRGALGEFTTGEWLAHWLANIAPRRVRSRTLESYETLVRLHLSPALGAVALADLAAEDVERLLSRMEARGLSSATRLRAFHVLSRALHVAEQRGHVLRNVARLVDPPSLKPVTSARPLTVAEVRAVLRTARTRRNGARWLLALTAGVRQSEALALMWADVDLSAGSLRIDRTLHRVRGGGLRFEEPKSARSRRTIVMTAQLAAELRAHRLEQDHERQVAGDAWVDSGLIFTQRNGRPIDRRDDFADWKRLLRDAGVREVRLHDARHTTASVLLAEGVPARVVSELLGHSTSKITLDTYSHLLPGVAEEAARRIQSALFE